MSNMLTAFSFLSELFR